jgi:hypothetical protein
MHCLLELPENDTDFATRIRNETWLGKTSKRLAILDLSPLG